MDMYGQIWYCYPHKPHHIRITQGSPVPGARSVEAVANSVEAWLFPKEDLEQYLQYFIYILSIVYQYFINVSQSHGFHN